MKNVFATIPIIWQKLQEFNRLISFIYFLVFFLKLSKITLTIKLQTFRNISIFRGLNDKEIHFNLCNIFSIFIFNERVMTLNCAKLGRVVAFMRYLASIVSLIFLAEISNWNRITFPASNLLNLAELLVNDPRKSIYKKFTNIPFSIRFITTYCKDFKNS